MNFMKNGEKDNREDVPEKSFRQSQTLVLFKLAPETLRIMTL